MYGAERQQLLAQQVRTDGRIDVTATSEQLGVAPETIRRDLAALERQGLVRRVYGGAILLERLDFEPAVNERDRTRSAEKDRIARAALDLVPQRGTVLFDAGTTSSRLAALLPQGRDLTIVTNSLPVASQLATRTDVTVHMLGGRIRPATLATVESWALAVLAGLTVDIGFFGTNGFSAARGCTTPDTAESAVKAAMVGACRRRVLLSDHSKYGDDQFARFATLGEIDVVVTDSGLDEQAVAELNEAAIEVVIA
ncbi:MULTISPECIES: DeoR/GlpR family DNA-binding transcription regulator [Prauserella salsuginis group]|uniref:Lactose phosphotransferase system repressor n=1 Tax=Prauserella salsuginis TaxID=387889 RepID=A0ABW6G7Y1_9PSEU|nr:MULTISPECIES: DeoR/GlpR family DNA-binding transcription regulator [Prauserella salsuginis group]MCR3721698.1 transcriptional regulator, DeoR family [Prauserella flava]MCR3734390.1 transcriptional regulator, DeoR family [Prauserella salsuginis]